MWWLNDIVDWLCVVGMLISLAYDVYVCWNLLLN